MRKQILIPLAVFLFLIVATAIVALYGKGYRFGFEKGRVELAGTGLLVATSTPDGAQVFIDGHLTTATDNTINLFPGQYLVRIYKEGYFPWEKKIKVQKEVVAKAESLLFPTAPKLESITASGVGNPILDPSHTKIAYVVASESARRNGIYVLDTTTRPILTLQSASTQIADDTIALFSKTSLSWSPDGQQIIASASSETGSTTYLLNARSFNSSPSDITATLPTVQNSWEKERKEKELARISNLKENLRKIITENFSIVAWSGDEGKILYTASTSAELPVVIKPRLIGVDSTPEQRIIEKGNVYVYDIKEDKNYKIDAKTSENLNWFPDSNHLLYVHDKRIDIIEYDGNNVTTIYAGPFIDGYVFPWTDTSRIVILTNLGNPTIPPNLYTISLK